VLDGECTYTNDTSVLDVLLDLFCVVKVGEGADDVHVFGDSWRWVEVKKLGSREGGGSYEI
jgi:hypothetical protein